MLDGDEAGQTNGIRSARLLVEKGFSVGRIVLEPEHDPDSLLGMMEREDFTGYIKRLTRFSRLEVYETDLLRQIKKNIGRFTPGFDGNGTERLIYRNDPLA